eukprot:1188928-Prorocentrum_minimum.AAC.1
MANSVSCFSSVVFWFAKLKVMPMARGPWNTFVSNCANAPTRVRSPSAPTTASNLNPSSGGGGLPPSAPGGCRRTCK